MLVSVSIIKTYTLDVDAKTQTEALDKVNKLSAVQIADEGSLKNIDIDYMEVIDSEIPLDEEEQSS